MSEEKKDLKIKLKDDKGNYYEVISTEQFNIQEELNKEIEINIKYKEVIDKIKDVYENRDKIHYKKQRFMCDLTVADQMYELLEEIE